MYICTLFFQREDSKRFRILIMASKVLHHEWKGEDCLGAISQNGNKRGIFFTLATDCERLLQGSISTNRMVFYNDYDFS